MCIVPKNTITIDANNDGKITMDELFESNQDSIPLLVQTTEIADLEDRLDILEGMIEYYTEGEEYEK